MLERGYNPESMAPQPSDLKFIDLDRVFALLRRQARVITLCLGIALALAALYLVLAPRSYVSAGQILIDKNLEQVVDDAAVSVSAVELESQVLNQIEVLRSSRIATAVAEAESLTTDAEFLSPPPSFTGRLRGIVAGLLSPILGGSEATNAAPPQASVDDVAGMLRADVQVDRMGRSSIIRVGYEAASPELAQRIARAYANAVVQDQLNADLDATRASADWLQQRLAEIGASQREANQAIQQFREESGLSVDQDRALSNQRIEALSDQLAEAQAETARIRAQSNQLQAVIAAGPEAAANSVALLTQAEEVSAESANLRTQHANLVSRIAQVTSAFGSDHPQLVALNAELAALNSQIFAQLQGLNEQYLTRLEIAQQQEIGLRRDITSEGQAVGDIGQAQVELTELQQRSTALGILYNSFLSRYEQAVQQQSFPIPAVRVITEALLPEAPSSPRTMIVLAAALLAGLFMGLGFGAINELRERAFRTGAQVSRELGLRFLGYLPALDLGKSGRDSRQRAGLIHRFLRNQVAGRGGNMPSTPFLETLKSAKLALRSSRKGGGGVVGIVSVLPGEGKSTFAVSFAEMLVGSGSKVLLVDADLRQPGASRLIGSAGEFGLMDLAEGKAWRDIAITDEQTGLVTIPANTSGVVGRTNDFLASSAMQAFLAETRREFDYVVIDLPPLGPVVDAMSVLPWTDGFILLAEWGKTPRRLVRTLIEREPGLSGEVLGVVLNKVDFKKLPRYSEVGGVERFVDVYQRYYQVETAVEPAPR
ncbi:Wzz/FepE/Etk N-terminal domain-containing protein [Devosia sp. XGJD_8]|uniref:Wzz/FepE/Etk N-terminal domain-containing protein n=1 Tax=Devosia sp. XGJD_8 TaxID=3391187 RepID=UPI003985666A